MNKPKLAFGLNLTKKPGTSKGRAPQPSAFSRKPMFSGGDDDDDDIDNEGVNGSSMVEEIGGDLDDFMTTTSPHKQDSSRSSKIRKAIPKEPPKLKSKGQTSAMFGDLSSTLASRKNAEAAAELDANVYEYDAVYDSLKPKKNTSKEDKERKPKYMKNLMQAADVRKRDALIAEEKKIAREREAEGEEFADKEKFVTEAYKKQQEENRRIEEEERRREEEEAKKNEGGGMSEFYRKLLNKDEERHAQVIKAAEEATPGISGGDVDMNDGDEDAEKAGAKLAQELNEKGASIAVNEDGQVVDKRQLLRGGLNINAKQTQNLSQTVDRRREPERKPTNAMPFGKKQAMRERQTRMMEEQLEQTLKRARQDEEAKREEVERSSKSRKTDGEISSAKERYLARKKAAEEEKKKQASTAAE